MHKQHLVWKSSTKKSRGTLFQAWGNFFCLLFTIKLLGKAVRGKRDKDSPEYLPKLYANNQHKFKTNKKQYSQLFPPLFTLLKSGVASEQDKHRHCLSVLCKCKLRMWKFRPRKMKHFIFLESLWQQHVHGRVEKGFSPKMGRKKLGIKLWWCSSTLICIMCGASRIQEAISRMFAYKSF